jgi:hypothetical protein
MNSYTFDNLISSLKNTGFDSDKVDAIKTTVQAAGRVSAVQMVELLKFISFQDSKLEAAKACYQYTTDPYSYGNIVGQAFSFSDGKTKLNEYIRQNPK